MIRIIFVVLFLIILFTGIGIETTKYLNIEDNKFSTVVGFIVFFCLIQILYYPAQIFNLSFIYIIIVSLLLFFVGIYLVFENYNQIIKTLFNKKTIFVLISVSIFSYISANTFIDIEFSDAATYINYIAQNININKLNMFNPVSGLNGHEWDIYYLYQGWYHFGSFLCWLVNAFNLVFNMGSYVVNITVITWGMGLIYSFISSFFIIDLLEYFLIKDKWFKLSAGLYLLFYANFYYWKIAFSFYGNSFRALIGAILIFWIYRWFKDENDLIKYLFPIIITTGISFTSSFLFIAFVIMFSLAVFLFIIARPKVIFDMFTFVFPMAIYGIIMFGKVYPIILIIGLLFLSIIYIGRLFKPIRRTMYYLDDFFYKYIRSLVFIVLPIILGLISLYLNIKSVGLVATYSHYFEDHQNYDMIKDYFFIYSNILDNIFNVIRWIGLILLVINSKKKEEKFIKYLTIITLFIFLNPLFTSTIATGITGIVYYRMIEVVFNPFTEILMFIAVYKLIDWNKYFKYTFNTVIIVVIILGNLFSFIENNDGLYTFYITGGKNTTALEKISSNEVQAIYEVMELVSKSDKIGQITVVSQSSALRSYLPQVFQMYTSRDNYYVEDRYNEEFYHIAKRHYSWLEEDNSDYSKTCTYFLSYGVDYILLEYWENAEFDKASDECTITNFTGSHYKVKTRIKE